MKVAKFKNGFKLITDELQFILILFPFCGLFINQLPLSQIETLKCVMPLELN